MRKLTLIPVWAMTLAIKRFLPESHPWKRQEMTLDSWDRRGTDAAMAFGFLFWISGVCMTGAITTMVLTRFN